MLNKIYIRPTNKTNPHSLSYDAAGAAASAAAAVVAVGLIPNCGLRATRARRSQPRAVARYLAC